RTVYRAVAATQPATATAWTAEPSEAGSQAPVAVARTRPAFLKRRAAKVSRGCRQVIPARFDAWRQTPRRSGRHLRHPCHLRMVSSLTSSADHRPATSCATREPLSIVAQTPSLRITFELGAFVSIRLSIIPLAMLLAAALAAHAQETPTERDAARGVV